MFKSKTVGRNTKCRCRAPSLSQVTTCNYLHPVFEQPALAAEVNEAPDFKEKIGLKKETKVSLYTQQ